jgi:hypothetical protein
MYIQKTKFYCGKCRTHDHWANELCLAAGGSAGIAQSAEHPEKSGKTGGTGRNPFPASLAETPVTSGDTKPKNTRPLEQAREFIKKVGRPKVYPDRKTQMRELMRRKRAK